MKFGSSVERLAAYLPWMSGNTHRREADMVPELGYPTATLSERDAVDIVQRILNAAECGEWHSILSWAGEGLPDPIAGDPRVMRCIAEAHFQKGNYEKAHSMAQASIAKDPHSPQTLSTLGKIQMAMWQCSAAAATFSKAYFQSPQDPWLKVAIGEALVQAGRWQEASKHLAVATEMIPDSPWPFFLMGETELASDRRGAAKQYYRMAALLDPNIEALKHNVAYVDHLVGQDDRIDRFVERKLKERDGSRKNKPLCVLILPGPVMPPDHGVRQRMFNEMKALGKHTQLVVASLLYERKDCSLNEAMSQYCDLSILTSWDDRPTLDEGTSLTVHRHSSYQFERALRKIAVLRPEIVINDFVYMSEYSKLFPHSLRVLSEHNIESQILRRSADVLRKEEKTAEANRIDREAARLEKYEEQTWPGFALRCVVSENDRHNMEKRVDNGTNWTVSNGYDVAGTELIPPGNRKRLLFIGTLNYWPNVDAVRYAASNIMPAIWEIDPSFELWVAGANPTSQVQNACMKDSRIRLIANPENMRDVARNCGIAIVPLRSGSGTRIKILESLAMGLPTVTTSIGCEGLEVRDGVHLMIGDDVGLFTDAVLRISEDGELRQSITENGRKLVENRYDWTKIFTNFTKDILAYHEVSKQ